MGRTKSPCVAGIGDAARPQPPRRTASMRSLTQGFESEFVEPLHESRPVEERPGVILLLGATLRVLPVPAVADRIVPLLPHASGSPSASRSSMWSLASAWPTP